MREEDRPDVEPEATIEPEYPVAEKKSSSRRSFSNLRRELSDEELSSSAVQRLLLDEIERLEEERIRLSSYQEKFHESDKSLGAIKEKMKMNVSVEIIHLTCMTIGGSALSYCTSIWTNQPTATIMAISGAILLIAGLAAKVVRK